MMSDLSNETETFYLPELFEVVSIYLIALPIACGEVAAE